MITDLSNKTYLELLELQEQITRKVAEKKQEAIAEGIAKIHEIAKMYSLTVTIEEEKKTTKSNRMKKSSEPKYRDPATGETWSGKGPAAKWLKAYEDAGRNRAEFLIHKS